MGYTKGETEIIKCVNTAYQILCINLFSMNIFIKKLVNSPGRQPFYKNIQTE